MRRRQPILITGSHRAGTTWVGQMLTQFPSTCYIGEVFNPTSGLLPGHLLRHWFTYVNADNAPLYVEPLNRILSYRFDWPQRQGARRYLPGRLLAYRLLRRTIGLPRPILKDPIAVMSAGWLDATFDMDVVCLVRHPAAFVASLRQVGWRFGFKSFNEQPALLADWLQPFAEQIAQPPPTFVGKAALLWLCVYHVVTLAAAQHPDWICLRLEDIAAAPQEAFADLYRRLDLPWSERSQRRVAAHSNEQNPVGAPREDPHAIVRHSQAAAQAWRQKLSAEEISQIRRLTEPVAQHYYADHDW